MEFITDDILKSFKVSTKYDIGSFIEQYTSFGENEYNKIVNFYSGLSDTSDRKAFSDLDYLYAESKKIIELFELNATRFKIYDYWILLEAIEDIRENLLTIKNLPKYLRSTIDRSAFNKNVKFDYSAPQGATLESIQSSLLGDDDPDGWTQTALKNNLTEEDYDLNGGFIIKIQFNNQSQLNVNSVVKGIETLDDALGLDIDKAIMLIDDDLKVLTPKETINQSAGILINLKKGDNPTFPDHGVNPKLIVGKNQLSVSYPVFFRQIAETISRDDTFKSAAIKNIDQQKADNVYIDIELVTRAGDFRSSQTITL